MRKKISIIVLLTLMGLANAISIYTLDEQFFQTNQTVLRFKIENNTNDTLHGIELHYRVVQDTSKIANPELYYLPEGMANWTFEDSVNATLVIYFPNIVLYPGDTLGGNSGFAVGLHNKDWSIWTKNNDPSQPLSSAFTIANNVEILSNGKSLMLNTGKHTGCPVVQFVEIQKDSLILQVLQKSNSDSSSIVIKNTNGYSITANLNESVLDSLGQKLWRGAMLTQDSVERRGEIKAQCNGDILAYFAYGWKPTGAEIAVEQSLWESTNAFVKADFDMGFNQGLIEGQRLALKKDSSGKYMDARYVSNWKFYRVWEEPDENPMPIVLSPVLMQYDENDIDSLTLEWSSIDDVEWYRLVVIRDSLVGDSVIFIDTTVSMFTKHTSVKIPVLPSGNYIWYVEPLIEVTLDENEEGEEYYYINGDDDAAIIENTGNFPPVLRAPWYKKLGKWAKKTVKKATKYVAPVVYTIVYDGNLFTNTWDSIKTRLNPVGIIQIFVHKETLHTKTHAVTKNMEWLQHSYVQQYIYTRDTSKMNNYILNKCFGSSAFCAMKDTRMLAENWEVGFNKENWDKVFPKIDVKGGKNDAVKNRCWLTMAQMMNHYKGGNISSDEILYNVRGGFGNTEGGGPLETMQAVNYALKQEVWDEITYTYLVNTFNIKGILPTIDGWSAGTPTLYTIISTIESGNIIGVSQLNGGADGAHSMVLNGYKIANNGKVYIHLLNTDNMGGSEWRYYCDLSFWGIDIIATFAINGIGAIINAIAGTNIKTADIFFSYYVPPLYANGRSANASVFNDSDGDGIVDFDEIQRFGTNPLNPDSDGDGINDYKEIYDYKVCKTENNIFMPYVFKLTNQTINLPQISYIDQSDFDGDGLHAAIDRDSDGDGYCDNQENNSCDRFDATRYPLGEIPLCKDYTTALLAKERLLLNDRTTCVSLNGFYCPVASYGSNFSETYGVSLGVDALIGNIYSTKSVLLRNRAEVHGNIETANSVIKQSSTAKITGSVIENSFHSNTHAAMYSTVLDNATIIGDFTIDRQLTANSGETFYSHIFGAGANNTDFIFNSGSNLIFNITGNLLAGSLKFQHGARLYPPTHGSVQFHIGNDFQWNGTIETSDMVSAAQRIMVYYYGTNRVFIQTDFAGTVIAPNAEVVIGQSGKNFYGAVYAKSIVVHQNTKITWVPFVEAQANAVVANFFED